MKRAPYASPGGPWWPPRGVRIPAGPEPLGFSAGLPCTGPMCMVHVSYVFIFSLFGSAVDILASFSGQLSHLNSLFGWA